MSSNNNGKSEKDVKKSHNLRNVPIGELDPIDGKEEIVFKKLKGSVRIFNNIVDPIDEAWNAGS